MIGSRFGNSIYSSYLDEFGNLVVNEQTIINKSSIDVELNDAGDLLVLNNWSDGVDVYTLTIVPEPSTYPLILGVFALGFAIRRRK